LTEFAWILGSGLVMSVIALVGGLGMFLSEQTLKRLLLPMVAMAAGTLVGGALFHMLPTAVEKMGNTTAVYAWMCGGFLSFFVLEQFLQWHHCHAVTSEHKQPLGYLLLVADGVHNLVGGLAVGGAFLLDIRAGIAAWLAAAAHEIPQELGDFGVLVHGGWSTRQALAFNFLSALTFPLGGLLAWAAAESIDVAFLVPFAAGNFIYIAAADLIPEVKEHEKISANLVHFVSLLIGLVAMGAIRWAVHG